MKKQTTETDAAAIAGSDMLTTGIFKRLSKKQKEIIWIMSVDDAYLMETFDLTDQSEAITLTDEWHNDYFDITKQQLKRLNDRGLFYSEDVNMCSFLIQKKYIIKPHLIQQAMNACC